MDLFDVHFTSTNEGWVVELGDYGGILLRYQNGSWINIDPPYVSSDWMLQRVYFTSANEGWATLVIAATGLINLGLFIYRALCP